jgi:hypothetical protein
MTAVLEPVMHLRYYRLLIPLAASLSLLTAACGANRATDASIPVVTKLAVNTPPPVAPEPDGMDTEANIFTVLGLAKKPSERRQGPQTGDEVSPSLWNAAHDTLDFVPLAAEDPLSGFLKTEWYSPPQKPNERLRVTVLITSRTLRADSFAVTIEREEHSPGGDWKQTPIARQAVTDLESAILQRARQIHAQTYRDSM